MRVGETATFRCRIYSGAQPVRLEWKVANNQHLPGTKHFCTSAKFHYLYYLTLGLLNIIILKTPWLNFTADNVKVSRDGSVITIVNVRPENHGSYRCVASNPFGITHTVVSVIVKGKKAQEHVCAFTGVLRLWRRAPPSGRALQLFVYPQTLLWPSSPPLGPYGSGRVNPSTWNARHPESPAPLFHGTGWTVTVRPC